MQVSQWMPAFLVEIHGHGTRKKENLRKPDDMTIEISSGSIETNKISMAFAELLKQKFDAMEQLRHYTMTGDF